MNIHWIHCIENFFTVQHFWTTCTCPEKQSFPWKFSLYWLYTFYHSGFLSNLRLPWNFSLYWIYFFHSGFLSNFRLPWKTESALNSLTEYIFFIIQDFWSTCSCAEKQSCPEIFHCFEIFFIIQEFWATCACPENRICPENFQAGGRQPPPATRLVRLWAYGIEDENTIFYIAWKMTISKRHE